MNGERLKILSGKGKEYGRVSTEVENTFSAWLTCSGLEKNEFLSRIEDDSFKPVYYREDDYIEIVLEDKTGSIGVPFEWYRRGDVPFSHFKTDAGLILVYISSLCRSEHSKKKMKDFIIFHKLNK